LRNRYAFGEAAVFTPRQFTELQPSIPTPEGPVHFAGEHTSLKHSWIEGALESAVRAALEVTAHG
jgi:monoamine oxidase